MTETRAKPTPRPGDKPETGQPWLWNVVLLDSDDHTYDYVIRMMQELFAYDLEKAFLIADRVNNEGRAVCLTTHKEHAELKRDQVLAFGRDPMLATSKGSMNAIIEPAECGGDEGDRGREDK
jgi:ATP-dependent Clp protease adaptor protein ClpS